MQSTSDKSLAYTHLPLMRQKTELHLIYAQSSTKSKPMPMKILLELMEKLVYFLHNDTSTQKHIDMLEREGRAVATQASIRRKLK